MVIGASCSSTFVDAARLKPMEVYLASYGNTCLQMATSHLPVVTAVVFGCNDQRFIEEAIDSALGQSYSPLQVILSDDCSSDNTFAIMQSKAEAYVGPHQILLMKQRDNQGLANHLFIAARHAIGEYLVKFDGDDRSRRDRVALVVQRFQQSGAIAVVSRCNAIDERGQVLKQDLLFSFELPGFATAYRTSFLVGLPFCPVRMQMEDGLLYSVIRSRGEQIATIELSLVDYRIRDTSLSGRKEPSCRDEVWQREDRLNRYNLEMIHRTYYVLQNGFLPDTFAEPDWLSHLATDFLAAKSLLNFWHKSFLDRVKLLLGTRDIRVFSFVFPRLFGKTLFVYLRLGLSTLRRFHRGLFGYCFE